MTRALAAVARHSVAASWRNLYRYHVKTVQLLAKQAGQLNRRRRSAIWEAGLPAQCIAGLGTPGRSGPSSAEYACLERQQSAAGQNGTSLVKPDLRYPGFAAEHDRLSLLDTDRLHFRSRNCMLLTPLLKTRKQSDFVQRQPEVQAPAAG